MVDTEFRFRSVEENGEGEMSREQVSEKRAGGGPP